MSFLSAGVASGPGNQTTQTVSGLDAGAAVSNRWLVVPIALFPNSATGFSSVTIGGETATQMGTTQSDGYTLVGWWKANVPTGTTVDVQVTANGTLYDTAVAVSRFIGEPTLAEIASDDNHSGGVYSLNIDVPADGNLLAFLVYQYDSASATWTGAVEDLDDVGSGGVHIHGASETGLSSQSGRSVTATMSRTTNFFNDIMSAITFTVDNNSGPENTDLDAGSFVQTGYNLVITETSNSNLGAGSYTLSGFDLSVVAVDNTELDLGSFVQTGFDLVITETSSVSLDAGSYTLLGFNLGITSIDTTSLDAGSFVLSGFGLDVNTEDQLSLDSGSFALAGHDLQITGTDTTNLGVGSLVLSGFNLSIDEGGVAGYIKVWDGVDWVLKPAKVWNGVEWTTKPLKIWNGSTWVAT